MEHINFQIINNNEVVFQSGKRWLFPLFDLEDFLREHPLDMTRVEVHDKVIGKAAALLILRLGAGIVRANIISKSACAVFDQAFLPYTYSTLVDRIDCQTEEMLLDINSPEIAYRMLRDTRESAARASESL